MSFHQVLEAHITSKPFASALDFGSALVRAVADLERFVSSVLGLVHAGLSMVFDEAFWRFRRGFDSESSEPSLPGDELMSGIV